MRNRGLRRPGISLVICIVMALGGALSVAWGATTMNALGHETQATAVSIGLGLFLAIVGSLFSFNFLWALRIVRAMRRGEGVIARWTVAPATFEMFRDQEKRLAASGADNDYRSPRRTPPTGLEVIFSADGVLIGGTLFGLSSTGLARFDSARMLQGVPPCIEFGTMLTMATTVPRTAIRRIPGVLRIPVAHDAGVAAARVLGHYQDVIARRTIVKPHFWRFRIRLGLAFAILCGIVAGAGFWLRPMNSELDNIPLIMAVSGTVAGLGGLVLALLAWTQHVKQHRG